MKKWTWKNANWIELGCRGWDIHPEGAGLYGWAAGEELADPSVCCPWDHAHLDRQTLDLMGGGCPRFWHRVLNDLDAAFIMSPPPIDPPPSVLEGIEQARRGEGVMWPLPIVTSNGGGASPVTFAHTWQYA